MSFTVGEVFCFLIFGPLDILYFSKTNCPPPSLTIFFPNRHTLVVDIIIIIMRLYNMFYEYKNKQIGEKNHNEHTMVFTE